MSNAVSSRASWQPVQYCVETDTMAIEIRPWPGREDDDSIGYDAGADLVIHYAPDGGPWLWEIEHASPTPSISLPHSPSCSGEAPLQRSCRQKSGP